MPPANPIPFCDSFSSADEYVSSLLEFTTTSPTFLTLCGGVHILDFFTSEPSLYHCVIPEEWRAYLLSLDSMELMDLLLRDDLCAPSASSPPISLLSYIKEIRKHSLLREISQNRETPLPVHIAVGMIPKKIHEVSSFAEYVVNVAESVPGGITHYVDFGSGQNYLGRTLASEPYHKSIVAIESKEVNIAGAKNMDVAANLAVREVVQRNKKTFRALQAKMSASEKIEERARRKREGTRSAAPVEGVDLRPRDDLKTLAVGGDGKGSIQYIKHLVLDGNLADVVAQIDTYNTPTKCNEKDQRLMAISIHSCGNLSHHAIRSLTINPSVQAIAIVGCCYNLLTSSLPCQSPSPEPSTHRPNLRPLNAPPAPDSEDVHGFPMSQRLTSLPPSGLRLNITALMLAVQAPRNWGAEESSGFFTRHFYRALLQKVLLDHGVVKVLPDVEPPTTEAVIIGSLRKGCYHSFPSYVRGAIEKLSRNPANSHLVAKVEGVTDSELENYAVRYEAFKKELSVCWSLMAFSAQVVESLVVTDRWLWLSEQEDVAKAWVEVVFEEGLSPRNLVVVGIKK